MRFKRLILCESIFNGNITTGIQVPSRLENRDGTHLIKAIIKIADSRYEEWG
jgi:hypothetical protein